MFPIEKIDFKNHVKKKKKGRQKGDKNDKELREKGHQKRCKNDLKDHVKNCPKS